MVRCLLTVGLMLWLSLGAAAQDADRFKDVVITPQQVADGLYVLFGAGGNIGLSVGDDGAFLIDDQYAPLTDRIIAAVADITDQPIRFVLNTHWHSDHTGGNENLGEAGALILAHDKVRARMSVDTYLAAFDQTVGASPQSALPVITFNDKVSLNVNGDEARGHHFGPAHTDGDTVVEFKAANVWHMGDTFFAGRFPFIDLSTGGSISGMIATAEAVLALTDEESVIIPGHGPVSDQAGLRRFKTMLETVAARMTARIDRGATKAQILAEDPLADLPEHAGSGADWAARFTGIAYDAVRAEQ